MTYIIVSQCYDHVQKLNVNLILKYCFRITFVCVFGNAKSHWNQD
jgi:hypothetical protein